MRNGLRTCAILAILLGLGFLLPPGFGQQPEAKSKAAPKASPKAQQLTIKVFKLERTVPQAVTEALHELLEEPDKEILAPAPAAAPLPGTFPGLPALVPNTVVPVWRATIDERTKAVIVRGSARHIQVATDLVAALDRPANAPLPPLQIVKAFALKHADATDLAAVVGQLAFEDLKLATPDEKLLVAIGPDEATKAVAELVKELDVPTKYLEAPSPKPIPTPGK